MTDSTTTIHDPNTGAVVATITNTSDEAIETSPSETPPEPVEPEPYPPNPDPQPDPDDGDDDDPDDQ